MPSVPGTNFLSKIGANSYTVLGTLLGVDELNLDKSNADVFLSRQASGTLGVGSTTGAVDGTVSLASLLVSALITSDEVGTPSTPASGKAAIYPKADGLWYSIDAAGVETLMSSGAAAAHAFGDTAQADILQLATTGTEIFEASSGEVGIGASNDGSTADGSLLCGTLTLKGALVSDPGDTVIAINHDTSYNLLSAEASGSNRVNISISNTPQLNLSQSTGHNVDIAASGRIYTSANNLDLDAGSGILQLKGNELYAVQTGTPEGSLTAPVGSMCTRDDGTQLSDTVYFKTSGSGNTGWTALSDGGASPLTTKGDLYTYTTADARLAVGADGESLVADSGESSGLIWKINPPSEASAGTTFAAITSTLTLTDSSEWCQVLTPLTEQIVKLPAVTAKTPFFVICNFTVGGPSLVIQDTNGDEVARVPGGASGQFFHGGVGDPLTWNGLVGNPQDRVYGETGGFAAFPYYWATPAAADFGGVGTGTSEGSSGEDKRVPVPGAGALTGLYVIGTTGGVANYAVWVNGVSQGSWALPVVTGTHTAENVQALSIAVAAGDYVECQYLGGDNVGASVAQILFSGDTQGRYYVPFFGTQSPIGDFIYTGYDRNLNGTGTADERFELVCPEAGTLADFSWHSQSADATTDEDVFINGVSDQTIELTGASGQITMTGSSVSAGDDLSIAGSAGTAASAIKVWLGVDGTSATASSAVYFGGDASAGQFFRCTDGPDIAGASASYPHFYQIHVTQTLDILSYRTETTAQTDYKTWVNGIVDQSLSKGAADNAGTIAAVEVDLLRGDWLSLESDANDADDSSILILFKRATT